MYIKNKIAEPGQITEKYDENSFGMRHHTYEIINLKTRSDTLHESFYDELVKYERDSSGYEENELWNHYVKF